MQAFNSYLCATVHVAHAHKHRGYRWANEEASFRDMTAKVPENETAAFRLIEDEYLQGPWVMGEQYTVADPYLFTLSGWLEDDGVDVAQFPKVQDHFRRMQGRPAVRNVLAQKAA
jgi:glutathione S-transferase